MAVWTAEDRTLSVRPDQVVCTAWVNIDLCSLGNRTPMSPEAVGVSHQKLLCMGDDGRWPPPVGEWQGKRFVIHDGRHELLASLMRGRTRMFVAWVEAATDALPAACSSGNGL